MPNWHLAYDQLSWRKPEYVQVKDKETGELVTVDVISYKEFLDQYYPSKESEQNAAIQLDRLSSFARPGGLGSKFKNTYEKMQRALNLPKGAKEELNYGPDLAEKIQSGEALWEEDKKDELSGDDDAEVGDEGCAVGARALAHPRRRAVERGEDGDAAGE